MISAALVSAALDPKAIPHIDAVKDAARLAGFADGSLDFVIANHVLEHLDDPIGALKNALRVIRPGGILLLTLPDGRHTFDSARPPTTVEHLVASLPGMATGGLPSAPPRRSVRGRVDPCPGLSE